MLTFVLLIGEDEDLIRRCEIQQEMIQRQEDEIQELNQKLSLIKVNPSTNKFCVPAICTDLKDVAREVQTPSILVNQTSEKNSQNSRVNLNVRFSREIRYLSY